MGGPAVRRPAVGARKSLRALHGGHPVTAAFRIVGLGVRTSELLAKLAGDSTLRLDPRALGSKLTVDGRFLGRGYGYATDSGARSIRAFHDAGGPELDTTYSGKSAACFLDILTRRVPGTTLYWATKSTAPLPAVTVPEEAPRRVRRWIESAERTLGLPPRALA